MTLQLDLIETKNTNQLICGHYQTAEGLIYARWIVRVDSKTKYQKPSLFVNVNNLAHMSQNKKLELDGFLSRMFNRGLSHVFVHQTDVTISIDVISTDSTIYAKTYNLVCDRLYEKSLISMLVKIHIVEDLYLVNAGQILLALGYVPSARSVIKRNMTVERLSGILDAIKTNN